MGDSWHAFKTGFARTRQKVLAKVGQAEVTKSPEYEEECKKVLEAQRTMKRVHDNTRRYLDIMKALIAEEEAIAQDIQLLAEMGEPSLQVVKTMEAERDRMAFAFDTYIDNPISEYMTQFKDLKERMDELEIRRVDMDRYFRDYNAIMAKSHPDPASVTRSSKNKDTTTKDKTQKIETKYNVTKEGYTALFNEMMDDIPKLLNDRARFFEPIVAVFAKNHAAFYSGTTNAFETALSSVSAIDDEDIHKHKAPITSVENSARYRHRGTTVLRELNAPTPHAQPHSPTSYPPASTPYSPPPSSYAPPHASFAPPPSAEPSYYDPPTHTPYAPPPSSEPSPYTPPPHTSFAPPPTSDPTPTPSHTPAEPSAPALSPTSSEPSFSPSPTPEPTPASLPPASAPVVAVSLQKGIRAKANFDFNAQDEDELSFHKGDILNILNNEGDWWEGELNGKRGNLPSNYVTVL